MTPQVLTIISSTSGVVGFLSLVAFFYYSYRIREIESSERSVRQVVEGEGLFNSDQILHIMREFKDDTARLQALKTFGNISDASAKRVYGKIKGEVNIASLATKKQSYLKRISLVTSLTFLGIGLLAIVYMALSDRAEAVDESLLASGTTRPFFSCDTHVQCQAGFVCVDNGGDKKFYCKPVCRSDSDCSAWPYSGIRCLVHKRASGATFAHRVCNHATPSYLR